ncbi:hypothetical protein Taro_015586 [Colocasia esculenta]|uniref:Uncharacterized protein n=1 Tax=Colocasia esculenta TaxID=4460 RepID=A0A843UBR8_COLES|nr:hypothetical protein [Colocasia esculenta]
MNGDVYRLKQHIASIGGNVVKCKQCPRELVNEMKEYMAGRQQQRGIRIQQQEELHEELSGKGKSKGVMKERPIAVDVDELDDTDYEDLSPNVREWREGLRQNRHAAMLESEMRRHQYSDSPHNDGEVLQGTINVISRLSRSTEERIDAMMEVETRQERDVPEFDPRDCSWAEGELDGVEAPDTELRFEQSWVTAHGEEVLLPIRVVWNRFWRFGQAGEQSADSASSTHPWLSHMSKAMPNVGLLQVTYQKQNIREAEEKDKGMDKGDMKDNNIMQLMSGHLGSQAIVQGLLIYLHFSLPFYRTQILAAHLLDYKEDGDLGLHKNKSIVKQQVHTNRLAYGVQLHHNLEKAQVNNLHQEGFKWVCMI